MSTDNKHLNNVDFARGVAIILVVVYHTFRIIFPDYDRIQYASSGVFNSGLKSAVINFNPFGQGWIGVQLFLVISGFLIHLIHLRSNADFDAKPFFSKRFWRIYPPYFLGLTLFWVARKDFSPDAILSYISHLLMTHNLRSTTFMSVNASFWSIALECQLYLVYPVYLYLSRYLKAGKIFIATLLLHIIIVVAGIYFNLNSYPYLYSLLSFWFMWCAGAYLADSFFNGKKIFIHPKAYCLLFLLLLFTLKLNVYTNSFVFIPATLLGLSFLELMLYLQVPDKGFFYQVIFKSVSFIGLISYSIYLLHQPILNTVEKILQSKFADWFVGTAVGITASYTIILFVSFLFYKYVELLSIAYGKRMRMKKNILISSAD